MRDFSHFHSTALWRKRLIISVVVTIPAVYFDLIVYFGDKIIFANILANYGGIISLAMATIAVVCLGVPFFRNAVRGFKHRIFNTDSLVVIGTLLSYFYSLSKYLVYIANSKTILLSPAAQPRLYFSVVTVLYTLVTWGRLLEARAANKSEQSIRQLIRLRPRLARVMFYKRTLEVPAKKVKIGTRVLVLPDEIIPVDGHVVAGKSSVNESMVTGESTPQDKNIGSRVITGTKNGHGALEIIADRTADDSMLARVINMVSNARTGQSPIETLADRIANVYVPFILLIAIATLLIWRNTAGASWADSLVVCITVIMVACPYAFGLAAPAAIDNTIQLGLCNKVLFRSSSAPWELANIDTIVFDKTGTLTTGKLRVTDIISNGTTDEKNILKYAASLESQTSSSLAKAIIKKATQRKVKTLPVKNFKFAPGGGITGVISGRRYYLGNEVYIGKHCQGDLPDTKKQAKAGKTISYLATKKEILGAIAISDRPKANAAAAIRELHHAGIETYIISGDNEITTGAIANKLGIKHVIANVLPDMKAREVLQLRREGHRVAMVGDGINDAPAIAVANVGIAMGTGTDAAIETSELVLASGELMELVRAVRLSHLCINKIYQNLFFALFYNIVSIPIAIGALKNFGILPNPEIATVVMLCSVIAVLLNSLSIRFTDLNKRHNISSYLIPVMIFSLFSALYITFVLSKMIL